MDNTEGSRAIPQVFRARKNLELCLSNHQMAIVLGSILGDAYIYPQGKICIEHGAKQKNYLFWKYQQCSGIVYTKFSQVVRNDKRSLTSTTSWRIFLKQYFRPLRTIFYQNGKKHIPASLKSWVTPLLLAVWYMDDGYLDKGKYPYLMTENYDFYDLQLLQGMFKQRLYLNWSITNKHRMRLNKDSIVLFFQMIEPYIHLDLRYKLP